MRRKLQAPWRMSVCCLAKQLGVNGPFDGAKFSEGHDREWSCGWEIRIHRLANKGPYCSPGLRSRLRNYKDERAQARSSVT